MYDYDSTAERISALERENLNLRQRLGEFGFFGSEFMPPLTLDRRNNLKKKLTVYEWDLLNNLNISYSVELINETIDLLKKLVDEHVFDATPITPYYANWNPTPSPTWNPFNVKPYTGEKLTLDFPIKMSGELHEAFKGLQDYIDNNVIITNGYHGIDTVTVTLCCDDLKDREKVMDIINKKMSLLVDFITDENVGKVEDDEAVEVEPKTKFKPEGFFGIASRYNKENETKDETED